MKKIFNNDIFKEFHSTPKKFKVSLFEASRYLIMELKSNEIFS